MANQKQELGFGTVVQTAEIFGVTRKEALRRARSGEWPSWVIQGRRVFDLDSIVQRKLQDAKLRGGTA